MKAARFYKPSIPLKIETVPEPKVKPSDVLIKVKAGMASHFVENVETVSLVAIIFVRTEGYTVSMRMAVLQSILVLVQLTALNYLTMFLLNTERYLRTLLPHLTIQ